jgi:hypothetical protein
MFRFGFATGERKNDSVSSVLSLEVPFLNSVGNYMDFSELVKSFWGAEEIWIFFM